MCSDGFVERRPSSSLLPPTLPFLLAMNSLFFLKYCTLYRHTVRPNDLVLCTFGETKAWATEATDRTAARVATNFMVRRLVNVMCIQIGKSKIL